GPWTQSHSVCSEGEWSLSVTPRACSSSASSVCGRARLDYVGAPGSRSSAHHEAANDGCGKRRSTLFRRGECNRPKHIFRKSFPVPPAQMSATLSRRGCKRCARGSRSIRRALVPISARREGRSLPTPDEL